MRPAAGLRTLNLSSSTRAARMFAGGTFQRKSDWWDVRTDRGTGLLDRIQVLLAEDDPLVLFAVEMALIDAGFDVITASSGSEAFRVLDDERRDVKAVLTDIRLGPGPSGWDVARHARTRSQAMPVIYVSGDSSGDWSLHGVPKSIMLSKPFAFPQLIAALANLLNKSDDADALSGSD